MFRWPWLSWAGRKRLTRVTNQEMSKEVDPRKRGARREGAGHQTMSALRTAKGRSLKASRRLSPSAGLGSRKAKGCTMVRTRRKEQAESRLTRTSSGQPQ